MAVETVAVHSVLPYRDRPYEWVTATAAFAVDPDHRANAGIVDLELAPRGDDGLVRFDADVRILRPAGRGSGNLLFVVANRGLLGAMPFSLRAGEDFADIAVPSPGDGFLLDRGWTIAWCGWQWDITRGPARLGLTAPEAAVEPGWMRVEWRADKASDDHPLSDTMPGTGGLFQFADYPTADLDDPSAVLTVRTAPDGPETHIDRATWRFTDATHVALDGGFRPFHWYRLVYRSTRTPVVGCGLLAIRDFVSHLRAGPGVEHTFGYGVSQSGRLLRQFLWDGLNVDESGGQVFDGVFSRIASGARGEFNHRYAQPSVTQVSGFGNMPPFDSTGLLSRQRARGGVPKVMFTNSASEYWRGDGALVHVDPVTGADLPEDDDVRAYLVAGSDHFGTSRFKAVLPAANPVHRCDPTPVLRALLVALQAWVRDGAAPPASRVPRREDGTAVDRATVLKSFPHAARPDPAALPVARRVDLGPEADAGVGRWPVRLGAPLVDLVSAVDDDGNEIAGVRLPAVALPAAAYTGWNPRRPVDGLPDVLYERLGSKVALPPGRPPVTERFATRADYATALRAVAAELVAQRLLLAQDVEVVVTAALTQYPR